MLPHGKIDKQMKGKRGKSLLIPLLVFTSIFSLNFLSILNATLNPDSFHIYIYSDLCPFYYKILNIVPCAIE